MLIFNSLSSGGTLGLFTGASVLSLVEIVFWISKVGDILMTAKSLQTIFFSKSITGYLQSFGGKMEEVVTLNVCHILEIYK